MSSPNKYGSTSSDNHPEHPLFVASQTDQTRNERLTKLLIWGKTTGFLYVVIIVCGMYAELGVRGTLIDFESPAETAANITGYPTAFRVALVADFIMCVADVFVAVLLAAILIAAGVSPVLPMVASVFRLLQTAFISANLMHLFAASLLLDPTLPVASILSTTVFGNGDGTTDIGEDLAFLFLLLHKYGYLLALVFFGISMSLHGIIILNWGVFPKVLGGLILLAGFGYIADSAKFFLQANYNGEATPLLMFPALLAEFGLTGWLLLKSPILVFEPSQ